MRYERSGTSFRTGMTDRNGRTDIQSVSAQIADPQSAAAMITKFIHCRWTAQPLKEFSPCQN